MPLLALGPVGADPGEARASLPLVGLGGGPATRGL